jgi:hypothetical protein
MSKVINERTLRQTKMFAQLFNAPKVSLMRAGHAPSLPADWWYKWATHFFMSGRKILRHYKLHHNDYDQRQRRTAGKTTVENGR